ncbi:hypothetical protein Tco_1182291 [Tanacetum coccineum]
MLDFDRAHIPFARDIAQLCIKTLEGSVWKIIAFDVFSFFSFVVTPSFATIVSQMPYAFSIVSIIMPVVCLDMDYWALLEHPPKGIEIAILRTKSKLKWDWDLVERLDSLAKRETNESTGKVLVHVVANSGHYIYKNQPQTLL